MRWWMKLDLAILSPIRCFWYRYQIRKAMAEYRAKVGKRCLLDVNEAAKKWPDF